MANAFDLAAVIRLDDNPLKEGLGRVGKTLGSFAKVVGAAVGAAATGVSILTKQVVSAYGEYEQLAGGVKKIFGNAGQSLEEYAESQGKSIDEVQAKWEHLGDVQEMVLANARTAFERTGMSTNEYLESATSFGSKLLRDLGGDGVKAAQYADMAMQAISDNWNTFGGDINMIEGAFTGFMRGNFRMLDNLKLGYGEGKDEMQRLIKDANTWAKAHGEAADMTIDSFADIVRAIEITQKRLQIYGTTANEAEKTIQGSLKATKAAWTNLLTALGDPEADLQPYFDAVVKYATHSVENIMPVVMRALSGIGQLIANVAPIIAENLPALISEVLPSLISAATSLVGGLIQALPDILSGLWSALIQIITDVGGEKLGQAFETLKTTVGELFASIGEKLPDVKIDFSLQDVFDGAADIINSVSDAIGFLIDNMDTILPIVTAVTSAFGTLVGIFAGISVFRKVATAIKTARVAFQAFSAVLAANPIILVVTAIAGLVTWFITAYKTNDEFRDKVNAAWESIKEKVGPIIDAIKGFFERFAESASEKFEQVKTFFMDVWNGIVETVGPLIDSIVGMFQAGWDLIMTIWNLPAVQEAWNTIKDFAVQAWEGIQAAWEVAKGYFAGLWEGIKAAGMFIWDIIKGAATVAWSGIQAAWDAAIGFFTNIFNTITGIFSAISAVLQGDFEGAYEAIQGVVDGWVGYFEGIWSSITAVFDTAKSVGEKIVNDIKEGITQAWGKLTSAVQGLWNGIKGIFKVDKSDIQMPDSGGSGHAIGLDYVPYNNYPAVLHRGEAVLTSREAEEWRHGGAGGGGYDPNVEVIVSLLQEIVENGLNANIDGRSMYKSVQNFNSTRARATNYNGLAMA